MLCAVDGTLGSTAAVRMAVAVTPVEGLLTLLAVTAETGEGVYASAAISPRRAENLLERAQRIASEGGIPAITFVDHGGPPEKVILECACEHDLLVMGAPALSWFGGLMVGGVAGPALKRFTTPMLLVRPSFKGSLEGGHILVASDGCDGSDEIVQLAGKLAENQGARVTLVHALRRESEMHPARIQAQVKALERSRTTVGCARIEPGRAVEVILAARASTKADVLVLGTRRLRGPRALGSVSRRVLHGTSCSVLLVPPR